MIGSSFGSLIALELASWLEGDNMNGNLILLDGGPDYLRQADRFSLTNYIGEYAVRAMSTMVDTVYPGININYELLFEPTMTAEMKMKRLLNYVRDSKEYQFQIYEELLKIYDEYDGSHLPAIESGILLIRTEEPGVVLTDDGLHKFARHDIDVKYVEGDHITMYDSPQLIQVLTGALDAM
jgi:thioesterase domain-containing protein